VYITTGIVALNPIVIKEKKTPFESGEPTFKKADLIPEPTPRQSDGTLFIIAALLGDPKRPVAIPINSNIRANCH
jgi:hypothetical protein